jgi:hypothetical protein
MPPVISVLVRKEQFSVPDPLSLPQNLHYAYLLQAIGNPEFLNPIYNVTIRCLLGLHYVVELTARDHDNSQLLSLISKANLQTIVQGNLGPIPDKLPLSVAQSVVQLACPTATLAPVASGKSFRFYVPSDDLSKLISLKQLEPGFPLSFHVRESSEKLVKLGKSPISTPALSPVSTTVSTETKNHSNLIQELSVVPGLNSPPNSDESIVLSDSNRPVPKSELKRDTSLPRINPTHVSAPISVRNYQQAARSVTPDVLSRNSAVSTAVAPVQDEDSPIPSLIVVTSSQLAVKKPLLHNVKPAKRRQRRKRQPNRSTASTYNFPEPDEPLLSGFDGNEPRLKLWITILPYLDEKQQDEILSLRPNIFYAFG